MLSDILFRRLTRTAVSATHRTLRLVLTTALIVALAAPAVAGPPVVTDNFTLDTSPSKREIATASTMRLDSHKGPVRSAKEGKPAPKADAVAAASTAPEPGESTDRVIVGFSAVSEETAMKSARAMGASLDRRAKTGGFAVVKVPQGKSARSFAAALAKRPGVAWAEPDGTSYAQFTPNDPGFTNQWGPKKIGAPSAWDVTRGSSAVKIAVVDTGVKLNHPDLAGRLDTANDWDFVNGDSVADDDQGHGTHVAGTIGATMNNGIGVAGMADGCVILPVKVMGSDGTGSNFHIADGIKWAADKGSQVINLSLGGGYSAAIAQAVDYAVAKDVVVVAATGNDSQQGVIYPARLSTTFAVGSTTSADQRSSFSNWGPEVDVVAPGSDIYSTVYGGGYGYKSGTSMATPHVAGLAGLVRSQYPSWTRTMVQQRLRDTAVDLGAAGKDNYFGYGRINAAAALNAPAPPPVSDGNDQIPGVPIPGNPVTGQLSKDTDDSDVYSIALAAGDTISASLNGAAGTDFDLFLYPPGTELANRTGWVAMSQKFSYPDDDIEYTAVTGGTFYLHVWAFSGTGSYSVSYSIRRAGAAADDDIPGVPIPASPVNGTLDAQTDFDDVYSLNLVEGQVLSVSLNADPGTDFDAYLYAPGATSVVIDQPVAAAMGVSYPDTFTYPVPVTGTYYLDAFAYSGSSAYQLSWSVQAGTPPGSDDDVPGVPFPGATVNDSLDFDTDRADVFALELSAGQQVSLQLTADAANDFDLYLFSPGIESVYSTSPATWSSGVSYPEIITYAVAEAGTYYVVAYSYSGSGNYTLTKSIADIPLDDDIPGVALPDGPVSDSLDSASDKDDVYRVDLVAGQWLYLELEGPSTANFDLYLFGPDATSVNTSGPVRWSTSSGSWEIIVYQAQVTGTHYVDVYAVSGAGNYTLTHGRPAKKPALALTAPSPITYAATVAVKGTLRSELGTAMPGEWVHLYQRPVGASTWSYVTSALTGSTGAYSFNVKPSKKTSYITWFIGDEIYINTLSPERTIIPRVSMGNVTASKTMYVKKAKTAYGYIRPRHTSGTYPVRIYRYRYESGKWRSYGYVKAKASNYSTYSKYAVSLKLSKRGKWRLRAYHPADSQHAATWSSKYTYVTVK